MNVKEILNITEHRPWRLPIDKWKYYQEWNNAVFLHWRVDYNELRKLVPEDIEIDLYNGNAWVSLVAFTMEKIRPRNLPSFSPISDFDEINIRTYVKLNNKPGVYFLSIEGGTKLSCQIAKSLSELPYRYSTINRRDGLYHSFNAEFSDKFKIEFMVGSPLVEKTERDKWLTERDKWLTERYALFQDSVESINEFEIHHIEWPTSKVEVITLELNYPRFEKLFKKAPDLTHYSTGVQVIAWDKKKNKKTNSFKTRIA